MHASRQISRGLLLRAKAAPLQASRHAFFQQFARLKSISPEMLRGKRFAPLR